MTWTFDCGNNLEWLLNYLTHNAYTNYVNHDNRETNDDEVSIVPLYLSENLSSKMVTFNYTYGVEPTKQWIDV